MKNKAICTTLILSTLAGSWGAFSSASLSQAHSTSHSSAHGAPRSYEIAPENLEKTLEELLQHHGKFSIGSQSKNSLDKGRSIENKDSVRKITRTILERAVEKNHDTLIVRMNEQNVPIMTGKENIAKALKLFG